MINTIFTNSNDYLIRERIFQHGKKSAWFRNAIKNNLTVDEDRILDTLENIDYSINEAIEKSVIKFFHPLNQFEFKYGQSCWIFENILFLFNYILDPTSHKKIGLKAAFNKMIIDKENAIYMGKKGAVSLNLAIEKKAISCEIIDLNLLNSIITSNIAHKGKKNVNTSNVNLSLSQSTSHSLIQQTNQQINKSIPSKYPLSKSPVLIQNKKVISSTDIESDESDSIDSEIYEKSNLAQNKILNRSLSKSEISIEENVFILPKKVLKESGIDFSENKSYKISQVFDSGKI